MSGLPIWLGMDQTELDRAYNQAVFATNLQQVLQRYASSSDAARALMGEPQRFSYGSNAIEEVDVFAIGGKTAPVAIFIHGGAWRSGRARDYAFPAELFLRAGVHLVVPDFSSVEDLKGDLFLMADQVRRAIAWVYRNAHRFGGNPDSIHLIGHSSGAHLAAVAMTTDWPDEFGIPASTVTTGLCCSGIYDLKAPRLSARSAYVRFTDDTEALLSPQRQIKHLTAPLTIAYGSLETPEFQRQAHDFAAAIAKAGKPVALLTGHGYNHFEILETLANPYGLLGRAALEQIQA